MKKSILISIIVMLVLSFPMPISATEEIPQGIVEKETVEIYDEQKMDFTYTESLENVNLEKSYVTLVNDEGEEKVVSNITNDNGKLSISFLINESFHAGQTWNTRGITFVYYDERESSEVAYESSFKIAEKTEEEIVEDQPIEEDTEKEPQTEPEDKSEIESGDSSENESQEESEKKPEENPQTETEKETPNELDKELQDEQEIKIEEEEIKSASLQSYISNVQCTTSPGIIRITANISPEVKSVAFPTWSDSNGQDDLTWETGTISGNTISYIIDIKDHKYETGLYLTHIYVYDGASTVNVMSINTEMEKTDPVISNVKIVNGNGKYTITANVEGYDIQSAQFPTWSDSNGQDDLTWETGTISGNTISYTVDMKDHKYDTGLYLTHIYVYDGTGTVSVMPINTEMEKADPVISNVKIVNGNGKYTITANVEGYDIQSAQFPTWSDSNGQDDLTWETGTISGNTISYTVDMKDHKYETGLYLTHIYVYDGTGTVSVMPINTEMGKTDPVISNVNVTKGNGKYTITANAEGYDIQSAQFPTWSDSNGQDDLTWETGTISGNTISYTVDMKDHKYETGLYLTHIYVYDGAGEASLYPLEIEMEKTDPVISNIKVVNGNGKYTITANVEGYDIQSAQFPTWSDSNGQDDLTWETGTISGNTISYTVDMKDHKYETGLYLTHIYVYDGTGTVSVMPINTEMGKTDPVISNIKVVNGNGKYTITANVEGYDIQSAQFPTWSDLKGQDDLTWVAGTISGNTISYTVEASDHNYETGLYHTHIYVYDGAGAASTYPVDAVIEISKPEISNISVQASDGRYKVTANVDGYGIKSVQFPTWTDKNGQDDLTWEEGTISGNTISYTVDMKDHNNETGLYHTHIYVYDYSGNVSLAAVDATMENQPPVIKDVVVSDVTTHGYLVTCTVEDGYGVDYVTFPTWTTKNGQDDVKWNKGTIKGNKVTYRVSIKDHGFEFGEYQTHVYAYDKAGSSSGVVLQPTYVNKMSAGFNTFDGDTYYVNSDGSLGSGFVEDGADVYYFDSSTKRMAKGSRYVNGRSFYFNSSNGRVESMKAAIPYYNQSDPRWAYALYGRWYFNSTGCVPTVAAMIFSFLNGSITPTAIGNWAYWNGCFNNYYPGSPSSFWVNYCAHVGRNRKSITSAASAIKEMKKGRFIVAAMNPGTFTTWGSTHEIVLYGIDSSNYVNVYDPLFSNHNGRYPISLIFSQQSTDSYDRQDGGPIYSIW